MYVSLSIHKPKPGQEEALIESMHRYGAAGAGQPGFIAAHTMRDAEEGVLVGLAMWESRETWEAGGAPMREAVKDDAFDEWGEAVDGYRLESVWAIPRS